MDNINSHQGYHRSGRLLILDSVFFKLGKSAVRDGEFLGGGFVECGISAIAWKSSTASLKCELMRSNNIADRLVMQVNGCASGPDGGVQDVERNMVA
ncbi:hypothetical protein Fmac_026950 [Flemingia macrophylla]|uniref:Uncharacterized protein n=1 Tax=Flemingia macrophylla TaxID=520843 RepID=A0ABD1LGB6_9FABA